jgi:tetratricopeptide (TPR) repeat protein
MDGKRMAKLAAAGLLAAAAGCKSTDQTTSGLTAQLPGQGESRWARVFGPPKPPGPLPPPPLETAAASGDKKKGISPETLTTFAKVQVDAAFLERPQAETDQLLDEARTRYQKVLTKDPKNAEALRGLAELYTRARDKEKAIATYQTLVAAHPKDHGAAHAMALACASFDEWVAALGAAEYALSLDPENRRYQKTYGKCLVWAGQADRALEAFVKVMPEAEARFTLGKLLMQGGQPELGRQQLDLAVKADPSFEPAREALAKFDSPAAAPQPEPVQQTNYETPAKN